MNVAPIYFYLPAADRPPFDHIPDPGKSAGLPRLFLSPAVNWIWRTHHHLAEVGYLCKLVDTLPASGIVVTAACNLPLLFRPGGRLFVVSCVADSPPRFYPQAHVFQSGTQAGNTPCRRDGDAFPLCKFIPHWPQPDLLPRAPNRGDRFSNIDYFGAQDQIDPALQDPAFRAALANHRLNLRFHFEFYHDYRETDAVLAVRGPKLVSHKPASKLINAWRAGVPAILGPEAAFRELRRNDADFIEAATPQDILVACLRLRDDGDLRKRMVENGIERASDFSENRLVARWINFLEDEVRPAAARWFDASASVHATYFARQFLRRARRSLALRFRMGSR